MLILYLVRVCQGIEINCRNNQYYKCDDTADDQMNFIHLCLLVIQVHKTPNKQTGSSLQNTDKRQK